ncbi:MAG TPA: DUF488 family protein [Gemmatimonadaceae bacterium]|nr:DUF488 family protein [Gemmatimonadaceae bacterium]
MSIRIVRLGTPRARDEGVRLGTVRRPPRGVPKSQFATQNWYDVWLPNLAPSDALFRAITGGSISWQTFARRYIAEMKKPDAARLLDALAALSRGANFSVGCYCEDEDRCHRSLLRQLLNERGAAVV